MSEFDILLQFIFRLDVIYSSISVIYFLIGIFVHNTLLNRGFGSKMRILCTALGLYFGPIFLILLPLFRKSEVNSI